MTITTQLTDQSKYIWLLFKWFDYVAKGSENELFHKLHKVQWQSCTRALEHWGYKIIDCIEWSWFPKNKSSMKFGDIVTEEFYWDQRNVLPAECSRGFEDGGSAFLVGEPYNHIDWVAQFTAFGDCGEYFVWLGYMSVEDFKKLWSVKRIIHDNQYIDQILNDKGITMRQKKFDSVKALLLRWGNNPDDVDTMMKNHFDYAIVTYWIDATPKWLADVIRTIY